MVGLGLADAPAWRVWSLWLRWRRRLFRSALFLRFAVLMGPAGLIAILAGWFTTEIGRQPWVVYGVMRTADAVSNHSALALSSTLVVILVDVLRCLRHGRQLHAEAGRQGSAEYGPRTRPATDDCAEQAAGAPAVGCADSFEPGVRVSATGKE